MPDRMNMTYNRTRHPKPLLFHFLLSTLCRRPFNGSRLLNLVGMHGILLQRVQRGIRIQAHALRTHLFLLITLGHHLPIRSLVSVRA